MLPLPLRPPPVPGRAGATVVVALLVGLAVGSVLGPAPGTGSGATPTARPADPTMVAAARGAFSEPPASAVVATPPFPVNARGMTYGSGSDIDEDHPGPDLVAAYGTNGAFGYVRSQERDRALGRPADGLVTDGGASTDGPVDLALYAQDGVTVVGTFTVGGPRSPASEPLTVAPSGREGEAAGELPLGG